MNKRVTCLQILIVILNFLQNWLRAFGVGLLNEWRFADGTLW
jgi:hypothetical protein